VSLFARYSHFFMRAIRRPLSRIDFLRAFSRGIQEISFRVASDLVPSPRFHCLFRTISRLIGSELGYGLLTNRARPAVSEGVPENSPEPKGHSGRPLQQPTIKDRHSAIAIHKGGTL
jgi:hypothetical protein